MLPKSKRLGAAEVREILKNGRAVRTGAIFARYIPHPQEKAAVVVSKKVAKTAVVRNKIRRLVYKELQQTPPTHAHIVFMVQKNLTNYTQDIASICSKLS